MKYRKKPVVIDAIQWDGTAENASVIIDWILSSGSRSARYHSPEERSDLSYGSPSISIDTLEGSMVASPGDYIIRGVQGEFYPCKPDIFEATYEPVEEGETG